MKLFEYAVEFDLRSIVAIPFMLCFGLFMGIGFGFMMIAMQFDKIVEWIIR